eukprot:205098-Hanusia_phi.AAC.1
MAILELRVGSKARIMVTPDLAYGTKVFESSPLSLILTDSRPAGTLSLHPRQRGSDLRAPPPPRASQLSGSDVFLPHQRGSLNPPPDPLHLTQGVSDCQRRMRERGRGPRVERWSPEAWRGRPWPCVSWLDRSCR